MMRDIRQNEIGEYDKEQFPVIIPTIEEGMLKIEFGDKINK